MRQYLLPAAVMAAIGLLVSPVQALRVAIPLQPSQIAVTTPVVVTGKVTSIEKDTVDASSPYAGAKDKIAYKVAVVKIDSALAGANNLTHIKIGFVPAAQPNPNPQPPAGGFRPAPIRPGFQQLELKVNQEGLFFLAKHPTADFYVLSGGVAPIDVSNDAGKKQLEEVKKVLTTLADPMKGLKSDKAEVRTETAVLLVSKYRAYPPLGGETEQVAINAEESKLILKAIAEADWKAVKIGFNPMTPINAFYQLGLTDKDGWKQPAFPKQAPGQPPVDFNAIQKDAFVKWLAGPGKDYTIKKVVAKKAEK